MGLLQWHTVQRRETIRMPMNGNSRAISGKFGSRGEWENKDGYNRSRSVLETLLVIFRIFRIFGLTYIDVHRQFEGCLDFSQGQLY